MEGEAIYCVLHFHSEIFPPQSKELHQLRMTVLAARDCIPENDYIQV